MKETFILRTDWYNSIELISTEAKAQLLDAMFLKNLNREQEIILTEPQAIICWNFMKPTIECYTKRYNTSVENGKKGGAPLGNKNATKQPINNPKDNLITT